MKSDFDENKNSINIDKHGVSLVDIYDFEWETAITKQDNRFDYSEERFISYGLKNKRLYVLVWTHRNGKVRPISFRKANLRERRIYEKEKFCTD
ncbi:MAG: BrnT family toxin [Pseudomonadota bacterium]